MPSRATGESNIRFWCGIAVLLLLMVVVKYSRMGGCDLPELKDFDNEITPKDPINIERTPRSTVSTSPPPPPSQPQPQPQPTEPDNDEEIKTDPDVPTLKTKSIARDKGTYLLIAVVPQQFASALQQGLMRFLKTAVVSDRTAVIPSARFDEPGFRYTHEDIPGREKYYPLQDMIDMDYLLRGWSCLPRMEANDWAEKTKSTVDLMLFIIAPGTRCTLQKWFTEYMARPVRKGEYVGGGMEGKIVDTLSGQVTVKQISCIYSNSTKEQFKSATSGHTSVMITQPQRNFLVKGWMGICDGYTPMPRVNQKWLDLGRHFSDKHFSGGDYGCVHIRFEKLVRRILLTQRTLPWKNLPDGSPTNQKLESCLTSILELSTMVARESKGNMFLMHDMQDEFGTATTHFDGMSSATSYKQWTVWAQKAISAHLPSHASYCGSPDHSNDKTQDTTVGRILSGNPRACALAEAAICTKAKKRMRVGEGTFGAFVSNINQATTRQGPVEWGYFACQNLEADAKRCRESGRCKAITLRNQTATPLYTPPPIVKASPGFRRR
eukprot:TRINITY_DN3514_c1_g2_i1.p1 TRINITY_DN3514_c1_g2~~TRINITY_DN3514_c1_g2_i1.p1  ORF type:complete len:570 (+),score=60.25 TRINITY_DN3514_c1_g2_i1:63-1712(+)